MKVALAYRRFGPGAAVPNYCWQLARGFSRLWETWAFTREFDGGPDPVHVVRFPFAFRSKRLEYGLNSLVNRGIVSAHRARERFDIVHTQDGELVGGDLVTAHSLLRVVYRAFRRVDPEYVAWMPRSPLAWAEDLIYRTRRYRHIIASSERMQEALRRVYGVRVGDISLVRLGVDTSLFRPDPAARAAFRAEHSLGSDEPVLLHVSTDFERKGLRTILRALALLSPEPTLVVAGRGNEGAFRDFAAKLGVRNRLVFLGYRQDLERVYAAADLFVFPTRLDFFGYPVLEAMACGVAPIVTQDAGVAELVEDGGNGYLIADPEDAGELADRVRGALGGDSARAGREARATAERFSTARMVADTRQVYERLVRR